MGVQLRADSVAVRELPLGHAMGSGPGMASGDVISELMPDRTLFQRQAAFGMHSASVLFVGSCVIVLMWTYGWPAPACFVELASASFTC